MPDDPDQARNWMDRAERASRKNARLLDKIRIALPRELNEAERAQLVRDFMDDLTGDARVPWFAGIHQTGTDAHNPHVHIAVHDREVESGKRLLRLSDSTRDRIKTGLPGPKAVNWIRERWETDREQTRLITERKIQDWTKGGRDTKAGQQQNGTRDGRSKGEGKGPAKVKEKGEDSLARAFQKAQQKDEGRGQSPEPGRERKR